MSENDVTKLCGVASRRANALDQISFMYSAAMSVNLLLFIDLSLTLSPLKHFCIVTIYPLSVQCGIHVFAHSDILLIFFIEKKKKFTFQSLCRWFLAVPSGTESNGNYYAELINQCRSDKRMSHTHCHGAQLHVLNAQFIRWVRSTLFTVINSIYQ